MYTIVSGSVSPIFKSRFGVVHETRRPPGALSAFRLAQQPARTFMVARAQKCFRRHVSGGMFELLMRGAQKNNKPPPPKKALLSIIPGCSWWCSGGRSGGSRG